MKISKYLAMAILTLCIVSCGGDSVTPVSKKVNGPLGQFFEIVDRDYSLKDGVVSVEFKRVAEGGPTGESWSSSSPTFIVELQDESGNTIDTRSTDVVLTKDQLEAVFSLGVGETASITFKFNETKDAAKLKVSSKWDDGTSAEKEQTLSLEGGIGKYPIVMTMHIATDGTVTGAYYYKKNGPGNYLYIKGEKSGDQITINEFTKEGKQTGTYDGELQNGIYHGHFSAKSGYYEFTLKPSSASEIDFSNIDFSNFNAEYINNVESMSGEDDSYTSGSEDWDALLDSYDAYVTKYISLLKKASKGDMSALAEYPSLMEKAQEFSDKMSGAEGEMSASQWARYMKITNRMAKAASQMK